MYKIQRLVILYLRHWSIRVSPLLKGSKKFISDVVQGSLLVTIVLSLELLRKGIKIQVTQLIRYSQDLFNRYTRVVLVTRLLGGKGERELKICNGYC